MNYPDSRFVNFPNNDFSSFHRRLRTWKISIWTDVSRTNGGSAWYTQPGWHWQPAGEQVSHNAFPVSVLVALMRICNKLDTAHLRANLGAWQSVLRNTHRSLQYYIVTIYVYIYYTSNWLVNFSSFVILLRSTLLNEIMLIDFFIS